MNIRLAKMLHPIQWRKHKYATRPRVYDDAMSEPSAAEAASEFRKLIMTIGPGWHPDWDASEYPAEGITYDEMLSAMLNVEQYGCDVYGFTLDVIHEMMADG